MPKTRLYLIAGVSLVLLVLFLVLPKQPSSVREKQTETATMNPDSMKLQQAIELVNGPNPMEGITILRDLVAKDSTNIEAQYWLGVFAVKSGQYDDDYTPSVRMLFDDELCKTKTELKTDKKQN